MATKKKATVVASKTTTGKSGSKSAPAKKGTSKAAKLKEKPVAKKPLAKTATAAKVAKGKSDKNSKTTIKKQVSPLSKGKSSVAKKTAKPMAKKATANKKPAQIKPTEKKPVLNTKKNQKKEKAPEKKPVATKNNSDAKSLQPKSATKASVNNADKHKEELKKAIAKVKKDEKGKEEKKTKKEFVVPKTNTEKARKYEPEFTKSVLDQNPPENNGPTMRYSDSELQEFRDLITRKLETAKKELGYLQGLITRKDQMGGDESDNRYMTMEDGSLSMEREQLSQMASRQITFIDHLEKAMMRIENKTYGICRVTGKLIDKARLRAVPHATLSIEAKMGTAK